ncbi:MAG TPA: WD40 repeat domain-containing protein [Verrucomicrobiae bacterium]|nr:WD40 repeat domain-containing protein [Verrucomicrobiae bacterium]
MASEKQTGFFSGHLDPTTPGFSGEEDHSVFFLQSGGRFVSLSHKMFVAGPDSLGVSGSLCLWDGLSSTPIKRISSLHSVGLCLPDGQRIAAASTPKGHVRLIDTTSFSMTDGLTLDFGNQPRLVGKIACSPDGNTIAATYGARVQNQYFLSYIIHCWNSHTGASLRELLTNVTCDGRAFTFGFTADSKSVVYMENARDVTIASASIPSSKPRLLATLPEGIHAKPGAFSSDGKHFALLYTPEQSAPRAWVAALKTPLQMHELSFREKPSSPTCCAFANESAAFALADDKGVIHILTLDPSAPERLPGAVEGGVRQTGDQNGGKALNDNM